MPRRALLAPLRVQPPVTVAALHRDTHASCYYSSAPLLSACGVSRGPDPPPFCRAQRRLPSGASSTRRRSARPTRCSRSSARSRAALCELERCCLKKKSTSLLPERIVPAAPSAWLQAAYWVKTANINHFRQNCVTRLQAPSRRAGYARGLLGVIVGSDSLRDQHVVA